MSSVILIAEDEASIADAIEIYLKSQGYQTLKAANGAIAWELLQNNTVDLAIIDVMMPAAVWSWRKERLYYHRLYAAEQGGGLCHPLSYGVQRK